MIPINIPASRSSTPASSAQPQTANVSKVADHIEHIAATVGRNHVGIASDFDGIYASLHNLKNASKYSNLLVELLSRGWNDTEIYAVLGENLMRVEVDAVKELMKHQLPSSAIWDKRTDLPANWGGPQKVYLPYESGILSIRGRSMMSYERVRV